MNKFNYILLYLIFFNTGVYCQKIIDSLENSIKTETVLSKKIKHLHEISDQLKYSDIDKSINYALDALEISKDIDNEKAVINSSILLSELYWSKSLFEEAMNMALISEELSKKYDYQKGLAQSYLRMGAIYSSLDNYDKSSDYYFKSLKVFQEKKEKKLEGIVLNNIGTNFSDQKKYEKAKEYFSEALKIAKEVNDSVGIKIGLTNTASVLSNLKESEKAKKMMEEAIGLTKIDEINPWYGANVLNLAILNEKLNNNDNALLLFKRALIIFNKLGDEFYISITYNRLANFYFLTGDYQKSINHAIIALEKGKKHGLQRVILNASNTLRSTFFKLNNKEEAYKYLLLEFNTKDSIYKEENITKLSNLELQYKFEKKQQEKRLEQQKKNYIIIIIIFSLVLTILVIVFIFKQHKIKSKNNLLAKQKLETELESKNKEFTINVLYQMKKNELLTDISEKLIEIEKGAVKSETKNAIHKIGSILKKNKDKDVWEEFELRFKQVHIQFYEKLTQKHPDLTSNDLRICAFLKLNMSTKEISEITGQRVATLEATRSRIRKKLGISNTQIDLVAFLSQF